jgi:hypothetical protein
MKSKKSMIGLILFILLFLVSGCISGYENDDESHVKTAKPGELIFHSILSNDTLIINETTIEIRFVIENTQDEKLYAGQNVGFFWIIGLNNSNFIYSGRTPELADAKLTFKPGNTTEYNIFINTDFFMTHDPEPSYDDIVGEYRVVFEWGIFHAVPKYFNVVKE